MKKHILLSLLGLFSLALSAQAAEDWKAKGKVLYDTNCLNCHGATGKGDGPMAASLTPKPRHFDEVGAYKNSATEAGVMKTLEEGIPGSGMVSFKETIKKPDRKILAKYIFETYIKKGKK